MNHLNSFLLACILAVSISLSSCGGTHTTRSANTTTGAVWGAAAGAVIGNNSSLGSWGGAAAGAVIGGLLGSSVGSNQSYYSSSPNKQYDFRTRW